MRKAVVAAAVAAAAVAGLVVAVVVSSGSKAERPAPRSAAGGTSATARPETSRHSSGTTARSGAPATTDATTVPVESGSVPLPASRRRGRDRPRTFLAGVVDDALAQRNRAFAQSQIEISRRAGFDTVMVSATWERGRHRPPSALLRVLRNVAAGTRREGMHLFVMVWHGFGRDTPRSTADRAAFEQFAAGVVHAVDDLDAVVVGNEPNLSTFWKPQFGPRGSDVAAAAYTDLLARTYDAVKAADPRVLVLGGALSPRGADRPHGPRPTHSPTAFIRDLGAAYRASGRKRPLMDAFAIHPYMQFSHVSPKETHPRNTSITIADYPKLVALLAEAFRGTPQPAARLPIYYTEFGVQTGVPAAKRSFYSDPRSVGSADSVGFATQAAYYRQALALAYCQPRVKGLFIFHTFDEPDYAGWQSGLYFADRTPKPSLAPFRRATADLRAGKLATCR